MQIAPIPQKALSPLLSHCGSSNRYPVRPAEKKHGREGEIRFPVESAITAEGITAQMFRIIKTGACFSTRRVSGCPCASSVLLRRDKDEDSEPKGPFCGLRGRSMWKEWGPSPKAIGGKGWSKYGPTPVRSKARDCCNLISMMSWKIQSRIRAPFPRRIAIRYKVCAGISPPCIERSYPSHRTWMRADDWKITWRFTHSEGEFFYLAPINEQKGTF